MQSRSPISRRVSLLLASLITIFSYFHRERPGNLLQGVVRSEQRGDRRQCSGRPVARDQFRSPGRTLLGFESRNR